MGGADSAKDGSSQWGLILQKADRRSGADSGKGGLPQQGRSCKGLVQREAVHLSTFILLRTLLATMLQFMQRNARLFGWPQR